MQHNLLCPDCETPQGGCFIGSASARFVDQQTNDLYLNHHWSTVGAIDRVAIVCIHWGLLAAFVESGVAAATGQPEQFVFNPGGTGIILAQHLGHDPEVQGPLPNVIPQPTGIWSNGIFVPGHSLPWHERLEVRPAHVPHLHYHKHKKRNNHQTTNDIDPNGKYKWGGRVALGTHVQCFLRLLR